MQQKKTLCYYTSIFGKPPFVKWLRKLKDPLTRVRIRRRLDRLEQGQYGDYKTIGEGLYELRLPFGSGYRVYFAEENDVIVLLYGGDKNTQEKDIKLAKKYWCKLQGRCYEKFEIATRNHELS